MGKLWLRSSLTLLVLAASVALTACGGNIDEKAGSKPVVAEQKRGSTVEGGGCRTCDDLHECLEPGFCYIDPPCCDCLICSDYP